MLSGGVACAGEEDSHQSNCQFALFAVKTRRNQIEQVGRCQNSDQHEDRGSQRQQARHSAGRTSRLFVFLACEKASVNGNKRSGQHAFSEQVLKEIRDAKGGFERVGCVGVAEVMRENALANQSRDAAEENPGPNQKGMPFRRAAARRLLSRGCHERVENGGSISRMQFITRVTRRDVNLDSGGCAVCVAVEFTAAVRGRDAR